MRTSLLAVASTIVATVVFAPEVLARVAGPFHERITEVPVERLLDNLERYWHIVSLGLRHKRASKDAWVGKRGVTFANGETRPTYDWNIKASLLTADAN